MEKQHVATHKLPQTERAQQLLERLRANELDEQAHYLLGQEYLAVGENLAAAAEFRRAVELNPEYIEAWRGLAVAYRQAGVEKEAQAAQMRAEQIEKSGPWL